MQRRLTCSSSAHVLRVLGQGGALPGPRPQHLSPLRSVTGVCQFPRVTLSCVSQRAAAQQPPSPRALRASLQQVCRIAIRAPCLPLTPCAFAPSSRRQRWQRGHLPHDGHGEQHIAARHRKRVGFPPSPASHWPPLSRARAAAQCCPRFDQCVGMGMQ